MLEFCYSQLLVSVSAPIQSGLNLQSVTGRHKRYPRHSVLLQKHYKAFINPRLSKAKYLWQSDTFQLTRAFIRGSELKCVSVALFFHLPFPKGTCFSFSLIEDPRSAPIRLFFLFYLVLTSYLYYVLFKCISTAPADICTQLAYIHTYKFLGTVRHDNAVENCISCKYPYYKA